MPAERINVALDTSEYAALSQMAASDCRQPREQLRYLLRREACLRGLLPSDPYSPEASTPQLKVNLNNRYETVE